MIFVLKIWKYVSCNNRTIHHVIISKGCDTWLLATIFSYIHIYIYILSIIRGLEENLPFGGYNISFPHSTYLEALDMW